MTTERAFMQLAARDIDGTPEELSYQLNSAPLGRISPAMEAAVATARFLSGADDKATFLRKLRYQVEADEPEGFTADEIASLQRTIEERRHNQ